MNTSISSVLEEKINKIETGSNSFATGKVRLIREYIVEATGLQGVSYYEKVIVGNDNEGYVDAIRRDCIIISLTSRKSEIRIGDSVTAAGEEFSAFYSENSVGHIVDIFGEDKIAGKKIEGAVRIPIEREPIPIMDRTTVNRSLLSGITGIDLIYPIGRGQRQLIIGDAKTGKTQITLDTIANQIGKDVTCIYTAIGKTKKEVKDIYSQLLRHGAMDYTMILTAFNDDPAPVLKATPYVATSIAYELLMQKKDVLIVIDDLKRHADVCREIALLMGATPGRDAYPPDIFYCHSRMLEMGCQHENGGSITILPICETKGGDITDYISTNIISITDGQIVLSKKSFDQGQKPAINYGLSVSRLGGAVQSREMKKAGPPIRRELLAYLEQKEVFELANVDEMGEAMRRTMIRGAQILEMLKQEKYACRTSEYILQEAQKFS